MDPTRFDRWARSLSSRRSVGWALVALGAAVGLPSHAAAKQKRRQSSFGCTKHDNFCVLGGSSAKCPDAPGGSGTFCVQTMKGKPLCAAGSSLCNPCASDADCASVGPGARCVFCATCQGIAGVVAMCAVPFTG